MPLYLPPIFEPERTMPPGNGRIDVGRPRRSPAAAASAAASASPRCRPAEEVAAADRLLGQAGGRFAQEFAVHHRDAPETPAAEPLGDLPAVAEIAQRRAELERVARRIEAGEAGAAGAGQHALADAVLQLLLQLVGRDIAKISTRTPGRPSGVSLGRRARDRCRLAAAADDRGGEAGHRHRRLRAPNLRLAPVMTIARGAHAEGFGKGVVDGDAVDASAPAWHLPERLSAAPIARVGHAHEPVERQPVARAGDRRPAAARSPCRGRAEPAARVPQRSCVTSPSRTTSSPSLNTQRRRAKHLPRDRLPRR